MVGDETGEWSDLSKHAHFVDLRDNSVQDLAFEWPEDNRLVLDRIHYESLARLYDSALNVIYRGHCNHEPVLSSASALHFRIEFLFDRVH